MRPIINAMLDPVVNFGKVTVSTGYNSTDGTITLVPGDGSKLPNPTTDGQFNLVWFNNSTYSDPADDPNVEIVRCILRTDDTLVLLRHQEWTTATDKNIPARIYKMILSPTKKTIDDIQTESQSNVNNHSALSTGVHGMGVDTIDGVGTRNIAIASHSSTTSNVHGFDNSGDAPAQTHGLERHTGTIGDHAANLSSIGTNTHTQIDSHIGATVGIHGFDSSGDAPAQTHGLERHTGIIGDHEANLSSAGTNTHAAIDTAIGTTLPNLITTHSDLTTAHGSTSAAMVNTIVQRDAAGRAKMADPSATDDIATKGTVDTHASLTATHGVSGTIVGTTDTQTLSGKTLTSPILTTPTIGDFINANHTHAATGITGGIIDHGSLTGLANDDHTQYHTDTRGNALYVAKNTAITGATKTKITYDTKGLVTSGVDATTADIADSLDKRYCTDAQKAQYSSFATSKQDALGFTPENVVNKVISISGSSTDAQYPSAKLVYDQLAGKQATGAYTPGSTDVAVADGGTGVSAVVAYTPVCGGTTTTAALQSVASVGSTGQVLTSNGTGALPTFQTLAASGWTLTTKTSAFTAASDNTILCDATAGAFVITLPAAASNANKVYNIKKIDSSGYGITIDGNASETIDGTITRTLTAQYECLTIQCDGANWYIL